MGSSMRSIVRGSARNVTRSIMWSIMRSITRNTARSVNSQYRAEDKLTGGIVKHDAKLGHQNLQKLCLSRDFDVCTFYWSSRGVPEFIKRVSMLPGHPS